MNDKIIMEKYMNNATIRLATIDDIEAIYEIYEPYILNTVITFEYTSVPKEEFRQRMESIMAKFPLLVCTVNDEMAGYAYCSPHLTRAAYGWDCECTIYFAEKYFGKHLGTTLYETLFSLVKEQGYYNVYSLICIPNESSVALHKKLGFINVGIYEKTAYKHGQWQDLLVMEKRLREPIDQPEPICSYPDFKSFSFTL